MQLNTKIILLTISTVIIVTVFFLAASDSIMRDGFSSESKAKGEILTEALSESITKDVINFEVLDVTDIINKIVARSQDVKYIYVVGFDGNIFAHTFQKGFPKALLAVQHHDEYPIINKYFLQEKYIVDVSYPLIKGMRAHVHIGMDESAQKARYAKLYRQILYLSFFVCLFGVVASLLVSRRITNPIKRLTKHVNGLGKGTLTETTDINHSALEVSKLAKSFNQMIARRTAAEDSLKESEERFRSIMDSFDSLVYVADMENYEVLFVNRYGQNFWGDIVGKACWKTLQTDQVGPCPFCSNDRLLDADGEPSGVYVWELQNTVTNEWYECRDQAIRWTDGRFVRMEIATKITERKKAEEALRRVNRALLTLSNVNEVVIKAEREEVLVQEICNILVKIGEYHFAWIGYAEHDEEKTVKPVARAGYEDGYLDNILISWADNEYGRGPTGLAIRTGKPHVIRDILNDPSYSIWREQAMKHGYASSIALPLKADQDVFGALNIYADIPDAFDAKEFELLKELAGDLSFGINTLRERSAQRKAEEERINLQTRLRQAQKMEAIGTLAGGIAHDFNNILTPILGYAELIKEELPKGSEIWKNQGQIITAGKRAQELVRQILSFSRQTEQEKQLIQIHLIIKEALKLLRSSIPTTIEIREDIDTKCGLLLADPSQIYQVIMNLCTNAYQAMVENGGTLSVVLKPIQLALEDHPERLDLRPGAYQKLEVSDTGCGIPAEIMERIFEPYFTTKEKGRGTGLGLSIVHSFVQNHHGHIAVYSEPGKGTTFHVYLPQATTSKPGLEKDSEKQLLRGSERILLVDDEEVIGQLQQQVLESLGYQVTVMTSSMDTLMLFREQPDNFDLVITDMAMPNMNGAELARQIFAIRPDIPVVLCTGFSELINEEKAKAIGISAYIMKPVSKEDLAKVVRKVMDEQKDPIVEK